MPTLLHHDVLVFNVTPHPLYFWVEGKGVVTAPSDGVLDAVPLVTPVYEAEHYSINEVRHIPTREGLQWIREIKESHPHALIVGSVIAARAYRGKVVSPVPTVRSRRDVNKSNLARSDRFTAFPRKRKQNNG